MLGNLANEVIFKKAFTDKFVLQCLVRDLFNVDFVPEIVETENGSSQRRTDLKLLILILSMIFSHKATTSELL